MFTIKKSELKKSDNNITDDISYMVFESDKDLQNYIIKTLVLQAQAMNINAQTSFKYMFGISLTDLNKIIKGEL